MERPRYVRRDEFELALTLKDSTFISPPDPTQQNWIITRALDELGDDLEHLDAVSKRFVDGSKRQEIVEDWAKSQAQHQESQLLISGQQVMQEWERRYMEAMAKAVTETHGEVLEAGFGMGISATYIQSLGVDRIRSSSATAMS